MSKHSMMFRGILVPKGHNIWGIDEVLVGDERWLILSQFCNPVVHRLPTATWSDVPWWDGNCEFGLYTSFLGLVATMACSGVRLGHSNRFNLRDVLNKTTPQRVVEDINSWRKTLASFETPPQARLKWEDGSVSYTTSGGHTLSWREGVMYAHFAENGSHNLLKHLIDRFGLPIEALRDLDSVPA